MKCQNHEKRSSKTTKGNQVAETIRGVKNKRGQRQESKARQARYPLNQPSARDMGEAGLDCQTAKGFAVGMRESDFAGLKNEYEQTNENDWNL